jgi:hypothetical protein
MGQSHVLQSVFDYICANTYINAHTNGNVSPNPSFHRKETLKLHSKVLSRLEALLPPQSTATAVVSSGKGLVGKQVKVYWPNAEEW